jgi:2-oxoglutarate ferredoxin oxidoreductase subunit beta
LSTLLAQLDGATSVALGAVNNAGNVARTKKMLLQALRTQLAGAGSSFVEILTMCPTGWFVETQEAPGYLAENLAAVHVGGVLKDAVGSGAREAGAREAGR